MERCITLLLLIALATAAVAAVGPERLSAQPLSDSQSWNASVTLDLTSRKRISDVLFGIFFEEASGGVSGHVGAASAAAAAPRAFSGT